MTSDKRQGSAWKRDMNKVPFSKEEKKQKKLEDYIK